MSVRTSRSSATTVSAILDQGGQSEVADNLVLGTYDLSGAELIDLTSISPSKAPAMQAEMASENSSTRALPSVSQSLSA